MMDFCRSTDAVILEGEPDLIVQQIDILFDTNRGEVLGSPKYGSDYEKFIHNTNIGNEAIKEYIYNDIVNNVDLMGWDLQVDVTCLMGTQNDIILVEIMFSKEHEAYKRVYKLDHDIYEN